MDNRERVGRDDGSEFLVNPHGYRFGELRARDLLRVEADREEQDYAA